MLGEVALAEYYEILYILTKSETLWSAKMKQFTAGDLTRNTGDLFEAATVAPVAITKHRKPRFVVMSMERFEALTSGRGSQVAVDVADMPEDLGKLLDKGLEDHFRDR